MLKMSEDPKGYWNEQAGPRWTRAQTLIDGWFEEITAELLRVAAAQPGQKIIDVGCGAGTTTLALAESVGQEGRVLGVDISRPLVELAGRRSVGIEHVQYTLADAAEHAFERASADAVVSRFGTMFFADPVRAFQNLRASLRPDGRLVMACWRAPELNPWIRYGLAALPELPTPPIAAPDDGPGPFSLSDESHLRSILGAAGFGDVELSSFSVSLSPGANVDEALGLMSDIGPLSRVLAEADETLRPKIQARVRAFLAEEFRDGPPSKASATWIVQARP